MELLINKFMIVHCPTKELTYRLRDFSTTGREYKTFLHSCSLTRQAEFDTEIEYNLFDIDASRKIFKENIKIKIKNPHNVSLNPYRKKQSLDSSMFPIGDPSPILKRGKYCSQSHPLWSRWLDRERWIVLF